MNFSCVHSCRFVRQNMGAGINVQTVIEHFLASTCAGKYVQCGGEAKKHSHSLLKSALSVENNGSIYKV